MRNFICFNLLLPLSHRVTDLNRPRAYWLAGEIQFIGHGIIGNGWHDAKWWRK